MQCITNKSVAWVIGFLALLAVVAGCAKDHALQPFRTEISFDRSRSHPFISDVPPTNAPSTRDWKTNEEVGFNYGTSPAGAASTPSGASSGTAGSVIHTNAVTGQTNLPPNRTTP